MERPLGQGQWGREGSSRAEGESGVLSRALSICGTIRWGPGT